jgi:uncharacterized membrane protein YdbT with pleckstrin-like domain
LWGHYCVEKKMANHDTLREGTPCRAAALASATVGFIILGGITLAVFLLPEEIGAAHYVIGGITGLCALLAYPWQILDTRARKHFLSSSSVAYRCGVLSRFEVEVPYRCIQGITVRQGVVQRMFGCGDVRISAYGVSGPMPVSQRDANSVCIRSIADFAEVAQVIREKLKDHASHNRPPGGDA